MAVQLISYDLCRPGQNYTALYEAIKSFGGWWHCLESVWLVTTSLGSGQVRDKLRPYLDGNDKLLVASLGGDWATLGLGSNSSDCNKWLIDSVSR